MLRRSLTLGSLLAAAFVVGCHEPVTSPESSRLLPSTRSLARERAVSGSRPLLTIPASLPSAQRVFGEFGRLAINPDDYVCPSAPSPLVQVVLSEISATLADPAESKLLLDMLSLDADLIPTYEALLFQSSSTPQTYGYDGEFTKAVTKAERDVKRFWDIPSSQIQVVAMHGTMLLDTVRTYNTYVALGVPDAAARVYARILRESLLASTTMNGGNYALWTFNAISFRAPGFDDKIVMGDGLLEAFAQIGFGRIAPQAFFAHEFAHQIQFENEYFEDLGEVTDAEATRYRELMADAMAAYYLTHARGASMNKKRVAQFLEVFYQSGDCGFTSAGHHGTPNQRMAAAEFGFRLADEAQKQGHILTSEQFHDLFLAYFPTLIAPDNN